MGKKAKFKNRSTLDINVWTTNIPVTISQEIEIHKPQRINIWAAEEHELAHTWSSDFNIMKELFVDNDIEVHFIYGAADMNFYENRYHFPEHKIFTHLWPSYYLSFTLSSMKHNEFVVNNDFTPRDYVYPFLSMNNRPHEHRCIFMDHMAKYDLMKYGAVSWHNDEVPYQWEYWKDPCRLTINDQFATSKNSYGLPAEWNLSFMNLVSECSINRIYFSEKTWIPLMCHKPFLVQSGKNFYKTFKEMGFLLYDEIFDYSFDSVEDTKTRTDLIMKNVSNIIGKDYKEMYRVLLPKMKHNFHRAITIAVNNEYMPDIARNSSFVSNHYTALKDISFFKDELLMLAERTINNF